MEHASDAPAYGLWSLVVINSLVFVIFAFSFSQAADQRATGARSARSRLFWWRCLPRCMAIR